MKNPRGRRILAFAKWFSMGLLLLIISTIGLVCLVPEQWFLNLASRRGSETVGRTFAIDGGVHIDWDWTTPYLHIGKVRLANSKSASDPDMVDIDEVDFHIKIWKLLMGQVNLPDLRLVKPHIILEKRADGSANWDLPILSKAKAVSHAVLPNERSNFPLLGMISIQDGVLTYRDATKNLDLTLAIDSAKGNGTEDEGQFKLSGQGKLQNQPFEINATGGSLGALRNSNADYPLNLSIVMGETKVVVDGTFADPIQMKDMTATLDVRGSDLADLFYLTTIPLPPTPPYKLTGRLTKRGQVWAFENFKGQVGSSDLEGNLTYDASGERGFAKADLMSHLMRLSDLKGFIGAKTDATGKSVPGEDNGRFLPDIPINLDRLRTTDLDIQLKAERMEQPGWPLNDMEIRFNLKDGVLRVDPLSIGMADGTISGLLVLDGSKNEPDVRFNLDLHRLSLKPFFGNSRFENFSQGYLGGKLALEGQGRSLADVLADSNGHITLLMSGGTISKLIIDAAGLDFGHATVALLGRDQATNIRCVIGDFGVTQGKLQSDIFEIDTGASNIKGNASINLKDETINAEIEAHPKEFSLAAGTPITVTGKLRHPSVGLDPKEITARGVAAAALAVLNPLAGVIPFIELGLGKNSDCEALIHEAHAKSDANPTSSLPSP